MSKLIGIASLAGATCLILGSALAQSQSAPAQNPVEKESREPDRLSPAMTSPIPRGPGPRVVKPPHRDVDAPRGNQDVQAPRENQEAQAPRGRGMVAARDVRAAQEALKAKGFDPGAVDGRMGPHTQAAVSDFQRRAVSSVSGPAESRAAGAPRGIDGARISPPARPAPRPSRPARTTSRADRRAIPTARVSQATGRRG